MIADVVAVVAVVAVADALDFVVVVDFGGVCLFVCLFVRWSDSQSRRSSTSFRPGCVAQRSCSVSLFVFP